LLGSHSSKEAEQDFIRQVMDPVVQYSVPVKDEAEDSFNLAKKKLKYSIITAMLSIVYIAYPSLSGRVFKTLSCSKSPYESRQYMQEFPWIPCEWHSAEYFTLYFEAVAGFIMYVVGIPLLFAFLLYKYKDSLYEDSVRPWMGFLYENYKVKFFWFEMVWTLRRFVISASIALLTADNPFRSFLVFGVLVTSLIIQYHIKPFVSAWENSLEAMALGTLLISYFGVLQMKTSTQEGWTVDAFSWIVFAANALTLAVLLGTLLLTRFVELVKNIFAAIKDYYNKKRKK